MDDILKLLYLAVEALEYCAKQEHSQEANKALLVLYKEMKHRHIANSDKSDAGE